MSYAGLNEFANAENDTGGSSSKRFRMPPVMRPFHGASHEACASKYQVSSSVFSPSGNCGEPSGFAQSSGLPNATGVPQSSSTAERYRAVSVAPQSPYCHEVEMFERNRQNVAIAFGGNVPAWLPREDEPFGRMSPNSGCPRSPM